jgi:aspartyl-tRNA(Asn)/glutamyl-tRNA(Gln) amidotransferase subunit B
VPTIGLEIHAELRTASKMFCGCPNNADEVRPNVNVCPICMGHPGTLPVLNAEAIRHVVRIGYAIGGEVADFTEWDRKNYFYPDIPKGYQISQYKYPLITGGRLAGIALTRIHLEEDTASSTHDTHHKSLINFNRSGVPLMELVTEPVIHSAEQAVTFARELQLLLRTLGAGHANLEKGEMRIEANISVAPVGSSTLGTKTEVKNLNSFRAVEKAIAYEIERQIEVIEAGDTVVQETRGWDENAAETFSQRLKENSHDYRYFPEPDIPKLRLSEMPQFARATVMADVPELPWIRRERLLRDAGLTAEEAEQCVHMPVLGDYVEKAMSTFTTPSSRRLVANYIFSDYIGLLKKQVGATGDIQPLIMAKVLPHELADIIGMIEKGELSSRGAKDTLAHIYTQPEGVQRASAQAIATEKGLIQKNDPEALKKMVQEVIAAHPTVVADVKAGKTAALQFLFGQVMKVSKGSANPTALKAIFDECLR